MFIEIIFFMSVSIKVKMSDSDEDSEITEAANAAIAALLPQKSKEVYEHYNK